MTTKHDLDTLDRATLVAWRVGNTVKWSLAALAVAFAAASAFGLTLSALPRFTIDGSSRRGVAEIALLIAIPTVLSAIAIGVIIGRHVSSWIFAVAAVVAFFHVLLSFFVVTRNIHLSAPTGGYLAFARGRNSAPQFMMAILEIYIAAVIARRTAAKRPRALQGI